VASLIPRDEKKEITKKDDLDALSGRELALEYARTAQLLLADYSNDDGID
jgi:hypothetical protein